MRQLIAKPNGWPCTLADCPPGHMAGTGERAKSVWFKSEYFTDKGKIEAYNEAGEFLCVEPHEMVQPIVFVWEESE